MLVNRLKVLTLPLFIVILFLVLISRFQPISAQDSPSPEPNTDSLPQIQPPQKGLDLLISPPILNLKTEPGSSISAKIKIKNNGDESEQLRIDLKKFVPDSSGGRPLLDDLDARDLFPQWLNFSEANFPIESKGWKTIDLTFSPPDNAAPAYYFAIVFNRDQKIEPGEDKAAIQGAAAVLCLVQVSSSRVYHQLDLQQLTTAGLDFKTKKVYEFLPVNFTVGINNSGNVHELAYGNIFIDWVSGNKTEVGMLNVNEDGSFILPQTSRKYQASWTDGFPVWQEQKDDAGQPVMGKNGQPKRKLNWDLSKITSFRIGKFNAHLLMVYNDGVRDIPLEAETSFWVIPWRILLALLVLLIILVVGLKKTTQSILSKLKPPRRPPPPSSLAS